MINKFQFWNVPKIEECPRCKENIEDLLNSLFNMSLFEERGITHLFPPDVVEYALEEFHDAHDTEESSSDEDCPACVRLQAQHVQDTESLSEMSDDSDN